MPFSAATALLFNLWPQWEPIRLLKLEPAWKGWAYSFNQRSTGLLLVTVSCGNREESDLLQQLQRAESARKRRSRVFSPKCCYKIYNNNLHLTKGVCHKTGIYHRKEMNGRQTFPTFSSSPPAAVNYRLHKVLISAVVESEPQMQKMQ